MRALRQRSGHAWFWLFLCLAACGGRGSKQFGEPCEGDNDCAAGMCVAGADGDQASCTRSCARTTDCPQGWACSGVTQDNVLVCAHGAPTPFGVGANE
jgi:hypothetical protein